MVDEKESSEIAVPYVIEQQPAVRVRLANQTHTHTHTHARARAHKDHGKTHSACIPTGLGTDSPRAPSDRRSAPLFAGS